ncbi:MAG: DUF5668 domain-containing protein [Candidatus Limnocylindrales bacterium]
MRVDRGYLFWGIFFVLLGAIPLADREGWIRVGGLGDVWRLWPLILIGIGAAILFSRTSLGLVVTVVAAVVLGSLAGTALTSVGGGVFDCVRTGPATGLERTTANGTLSPGSEVGVRIDCGDLRVSTAPGGGWSLDAGHGGGPPRVDASSTDLSIEPAEGAPRRQDWVLALPGSLGSLRVDSNASSATLDLTGATVARLRSNVNAGDLHVTAPSGQMDSLELEANAADVDLLAPSVDIANLDVEANAASIELRLGGSVTGSIEGAAMSVRVCVPSTSALEIHTTDDFAFAEELQATGLVETDDGWTRAGSGPRVELTVGGTAASFTLADEEACA